MPLSTIASLFWAWIVDPGLTLGLWLIIALLIPRAGRLAMYLITNKIVAPDEDDTKTQLALAGVLVYLAQIAAYFLVFVFALSALGFSLAGAAIPAAPAAAALGFWRSVDYCGLYCRVFRVEREAIWRGRLGAV